MARKAKSEEAVVLPVVGEIWIDADPRAKNVRELVVKSVDVNAETAMGQKGVVVVANPDGRESKSWLGRYNGEKGGFRRKVIDVGEVKP